MIIFVAQHPVPLLRMSWEGLYVALSRVKYRDHIRLAVDRSTLEGEKKALQYMEKLRKNKYTDWFFRGFKSIGADGVETQSQVMGWTREAAWKAAGFDKLSEEKMNVEKSQVEKNRRKRTMLDIQNDMHLKHTIKGTHYSLRKKMRLKHGLKK